MFPLSKSDITKSVTIQDVIPTQSGGTLESLPSSIGLSSTSSTYDLRSVLLINVTEDSLSPKFRSSLYRILTETGVFCFIISAIFVLNYTPLIEFYLVSGFIFPILIF